MTLTNARLGPYMIRELIGVGGTSEVYRADHVEGGAPVVVKVIRPERKADPAQLKSLKNEFSILERRLHPGIPVGRRLAEVSGRPCIVMDFLSGDSLSDVLALKAKHTHLPVNGLRVLADLCGIVQAIHEAEFIHNDIKLENCILRPDGSLALVDFGSVRSGAGKNLLASLFSRSEKTVFGTATYLAPELIAGSQPTYQSDVYALGVCAFRLLTGRFPFDASTQSSRIKANAASAPPSLAGRIPNVPPGPATVVDMCLAKSPKERTPNVQALQAAVRQMIERSKTQGSIRPS